MRKIITRQESIPVPTRNYAWSAIREYLDIGEHIGTGATEAAAIADLLELEKYH